MADRDFLFPLVFLCNFALSFFFSCSFYLSLSYFQFIGMSSTLAVLRFSLLMLLLLQLKERRNTKEGSSWVVPQKADQN